MNYKKIYYSIIEKYGRKIKPLDVYSERHHIIPACIGGSNDDENLIYLDSRCHLLVHWLLVRIYPKNYELSHAFSMMCLMKNKCMERKKPPLHVLSEARKRKAVAQSEKLKGSKIEFNTKEAVEKRVQTAIKNGSYRGLKNGKAVAVDVYNYFTGELVASKVSVTEWGRENNIKRNLNTTLYADRDKKSTSKNRHHAKGYYVVLHGHPPYPAKGEVYKGPYSNQGHIGLKKERLKI
jgi:hypothetical protein